MYSFLSYTNRNRRIAIPVGLVILFILYTSPSWLNWSWNSTRIMTMDPLNVCLESKLAPFRRVVEQADAVIRHKSDTQDSTNFVPYVGNGYFGLAVDEISQLYIKLTRTLSQPVPFSPRVHVNLKGLVSRDAEVTDFLSGSVYAFRCYQLGGQCVGVTTHMYAHRTRLGVFVQDVHVHNPLSEPVTAEINVKGMLGWPGMTTEIRGKNIVYVGTVTSEPSPTNVNIKNYAVAIAHQKIDELVTLLSGNTWRQTLLVAVEYIEFDVREPPISEERKRALANSVHTMLTTAQLANIADLTKEHTLVWTKLWLSGFSISQSKARGVLNGDRINTTIYNVLSQVTAPLHDPLRPDREELEFKVHFPDHCYSGHHTLQNPKMWGDMSSVKQLLDVVRTWIITLEKNDCSNVLKAGADGVMQAMVLSFGAFRMTNNHLEMGVRPKDLDRDQMFRRINYGNRTHVNVSVEIGDDNKAVLYVMLDANDKLYYACDAGCVDIPLRLSKERTQFPVKLTEPLMPILYVSVDREHLEELQHAIHVKEIAEAPAHEHHVIAMHKHGHQYGGLPVFFWVSLGVLLLVFHMFLFKLIYNEYCGTPTEYEQSRSRYRHV